jgi:hypothetical protein
MNAIRASRGGAPPCGTTVKLNWSVATSVAAGTLIDTATEAV